VEEIGPISSILPDNNLVGKSKTVFISTPSTSAANALALRLAERLTYRLQSCGCL
jgi:hypothetical protein